MYLSSCESVYRCTTAGHVCVSMTCRRECRRQGNLSGLLWQTKDAFHSVVMDSLAVSEIGRPGVTETHSACCSSHPPLFGLCQTLVRFAGPGQTQFSVTVEGTTQHPIRLGKLFPGIRGLCVFFSPQFPNRPQVPLLSIF